jgi:hypothetical protein
MANDEVWARSVAKMRQITAADWRRTFGQNAIGALVAYVVMDALCAALGMGVPVACILLGLGVGWFGALRAEFYLGTPALAMRRVLRYAWITSGVTFVIMLGVWGRLIRFLLNPRVDPGSMGLPLILYDPLASFIGWLVLMILIAPALQFLTTLGGAYLTFAARLRADGKTGVSRYFGTWGGAREQASDEGGAMKAPGQNADPGGR